MNSSGIERYHLVNQSTHTCVTSIRHISDISVNDCRLYIFVFQQLLNCPDVVTIFKEMGSRYSKTPLYTA